MVSVLVVTPEFPWPLDSGSKIREYHTVRVLADRFDVTLVSLCSPEVSETNVEHVERLGARVHVVPHGRSKSEALRRFAFSRKPYRVAKFENERLTDELERLFTDSSFDFAWIHFLNTVTALPNDLTCPIILDQHNAERQYWESFESGNLAERLFARVNIRRLKRLQSRYRDGIDVILSVDEADAHEVRSWTDAPVFLAPNGVDTQKFTPTTDPSDCGRSILFVGSLDVRMNEEALVWFVEHAWPDVYTRAPDATFCIVGRNPTPTVRNLADEPGVEVVGPVQDVVPYYDDTSVFVAPFSFGGGTKLKILEALAMERGLITTPTGAKGVTVEDRTHAVVSSRDESFAEDILTLLENPAMCDQFGRAGRDLVEDSYSWDAILDNTVEAVTSHLGLE